MTNTTATGEFRRIMENTDPAKIVSTLMYDPETDGKKLDGWESRLEDEFYKTFGKISSMLPDGFQHTDDLKTAIYDMADVHDEVYFHLGMLYGFNLYKKFSTDYQKYNLDKDAGAGCNDKDFLNSLKKQIEEYSSQL